MPLSKIEECLRTALADIENKGIIKGAENAIRHIREPEGTRGYRYLLEGRGDKEFIRMNSNSYLGFSFRKEIIEAGEQATKDYGLGPGAVRFISGTFKPHQQLERRLADFHSRQDAMIYSSAYMAMLGVVVPLVTNETIIISDALNHNCIINAVRLSRPKQKMIWVWLLCDGL